MLNGFCNFKPTDSINYYSTCVFWRYQHFGKFYLCVIINKLYKRDKLYEILCNNRFDRGFQQKKKKDLTEKILISNSYYLACVITNKLYNKNKL